MFYLRKESFTNHIEAITKTDGTVIPARDEIVPTRAIFKHRRFSRYYREVFHGMDTSYPDLKLYTCKTLKTILSLRKMTFEYCGEWFDVYDENGIVHGEWENVSAEG